MVSLGILVETTGGRRNRQFAYVQYLDHFREQISVLKAPVSDEFVPDNST
jgi:hypothetical protein